jgi:two-component system, chemotaxis family, response regulator Rcp1
MRPFRSRATPIKLTPFDVVSHIPLELPQWPYMVPAALSKDNRLMDVLLVEDSPGDARLTVEAFREANPFLRLHVVTDGTEAIAFLRHEGVHVLAPRPELILLDLNLPKMDGREVLAVIKTDESLKMIPTVILTTSEAAEDIVKSYQLQANGYLCKPVEFEAFDALVKSINDYWLTKTKLAPSPLKKPLAL